MLRGIGLMMVALLVGDGVARADNATFCVTCAGPAATYRCEVIPPDDGIMVQSPQLFCAGEVARSKGHSTCAVSRAAANACGGDSVVLAYTGPVTRPDDTADAVVGAPATTRTKTAPPKTLLEATDRAVQSSGQQLKNAGKTVETVTKGTGKKITETGKAVTSSVGKAAKTTWGCVVSLFQDC